MSNSEVEPALTPAIINQAQVNEQLRCSVCHEDYRLNEPVSRLICTHVFHQSCITPWLERRDTCPVCRRVLRESPHPDPETDDDLFADDEDEGATVDDVEQEVVVFDNAIGDGLVTVSVQYRSLLDQQNRNVFQTNTVTSRSSDISITISDSDSGSDIPDFYDVNSSSLSSGNSDIGHCTTSFEQPPIDLEILSDCDSPHVCFLELQNSYDLDSSDSSVDMDFELDTIDPEDIDFPHSSNFLDSTFESTMDMDIEFL